MSHKQNVSILLLRLAMGFFLFYAGISKIVNPDWSAEGYLSGAESMSWLFDWFASPANLPWVNALNEWGLTFIGLALIFGLLVRLMSYTGILLMILYYFPALSFPYAGEHGFLIDDHIIYVFVFVVLIVFNAGIHWGIDRLFTREVQT